MSDNQPIAPMIHLNGSDGRQMLDDHLDVLDALLAAEKALGGIMPHGRDYYPMDATLGQDVALRRAQAQHQRWQQSLIDLRAEVESVAHDISRQVVQRQGRARR